MLLARTGRRGLNEEVEDDGLLASATTASATSEASSADGTAVYDRRVASTTW